ncbi:hypothetical protein [Streptomyces sp. Isolate_219]|uniref:hypothetical protein n=1 Tax=Streptomyces sp. Isolate_219 TaxID=2950110 RepID=UPI0021CA2486|nr:hypothetical protein [Streptomyces sp. Isolate_219]MCR8578844.1 hypothetical protein [Streptomyces sp. Isolate_219]
MGALGGNGVTEGFPLKDFNDPVDVTKCFYLDLVASVSAEYELWLAAEGETAQAVEGGSHGWELLSVGTEERNEEG